MKKLMQGVNRLWLSSALLCLASTMVHAEDTAPLMRSDGSYDIDQLSVQDPIKGLKISAVGDCIESAGIVAMIAQEPIGEHHDDWSTYQAKIARDTDWAKDQRIREKLLALGQWVYALPTEEVAHPKALGHRFFRDCLRMQHEKIEAEFGGQAQH